MLYIGCHLGVSQGIREVAQQKPLIKKTSENF
jgi:hypothetical protein